MLTGPSKPTTMFRLLILAALLLPGAIHSQQTFQLNLPMPCSNCVIHSDTLAISTCDAYMSPSGNELWTQSGFYQDTLYHLSFCDTVIAVDLTITIVDTAIVRIGDTLVSQATGASYQWIDCQTGQTITGATTNTYIPAISGDYAVIVTQNGCTDTSTCLNVVLGIEEALRNRVTVFPNPTSGSVTIQFLEPLPQVTAMVIDPNGRLVGRYAYNQPKQFIISLPETPGVYMLRLLTQEGQGATFNIIRQ